LYLTVLYMTSVHITGVCLQLRHQSSMLIVVGLLCWAGDGYPGWEGQPAYGMPPGYPGPYDYSAYYGQQAAAAPAYGAYGQPPTAYPMPDPYAAYAAAAASAPAPAVPSTG